MAKEFDLNQAYESFLKELREKGEGEGDDDERRFHPRFEISAGSVKVLVEPKVLVVDVSSSGMAFNSSMPFETGQLVTMALPNIFSVEAEVIRCEFTEPDEIVLEAHYRVQCHFLEEDLGMQLLVLLKQIDSLDES